MGGAHAAESVAGIRRNTQLMKATFTVSAILQHDGEAVVFSVEGRYSIEYCGERLRFQSRNPSAGDGSDAIWKGSKVAQTQ
jgi:hypothetical protein